MTNASAARGVIFPAGISRPAVAVLTWTAGFDILYSLQDASFDRSNGLHSVPARFSAVHSTLISILLHVFAVAAVAVLGALYRLGVWYWVGFGLFTAVLVVQHVLYRPSRIDRIGASFGLVNGLASVSYAAMSIVALLTA